MRNKDIYIPYYHWVQAAIRRDGYTEIIEEDHPVLKQIWDIKHMVFVALTMREYDDYMSMNSFARQQYIQERALELIQK